MEKAKQQVGNSKPSSTFTNDLFGPKESSSSSIFGSVFGPASTGLGRNPPHNPATPQMGYKDNSGNRGNNDGGNNKEISPIMPQNGVAGNNNDACYFNSSIFYGGQQVYSANNTTNKTNPSHVLKGDEGKYDDSNGTSRGNWWQGSFYY